LGGGDTPARKKNQGTGAKAEKGVYSKDNRKKTKTREGRGTLRKKPGTGGLLEGTGNPRRKTSN